MEPPILDTRPCLFQRKKDLGFDEIAGPVKKMAIHAATRPAKEINKIIQLRTQISKRFTQTDYSNNKTHTLAIKLAIKNLRFTRLFSVHRPLFFSRDRRARALTGTGGQLGFMVPRYWSRETVPCPLGRFDSHHQATLGTFETKMAARKDDLTEKQGAVNCLEICKSSINQNILMVAQNVSQILSKTMAYSY